MKIAIDEDEQLYKQMVMIKGDEPFIQFGNAGIYVNFKDLSGRSHTFVEDWGARIPLNKLKKGEVFRIDVSRVSFKEKHWYDFVVDFWKKVF